MGKLIFAINPGSTSTKIALFEDDKMLVKEELSYDAADISKYKRAIDQLEMRKQSILDFLEKHQIDPKKFDIIVARGGSLPPIKGGAYRVDDYMVDVLTYAPLAQHVSNLACMIGKEIGDQYNIPVIIYDAPGTDEFIPEAKMTGLPEVEIIPVSHVLNTRKVARDVAKKLDKEYEKCRFIVAHLGGGISINAHCEGKIIDSVYDDMGPMSPQRAGRIPTRFMAKLCYSGKYTYDEMKRKLIGQGGVIAYLGTQDLRKVTAMIEAGDELAKKVFYAMAYQIAKGIGELAPVLHGKIDRIILTGGGAHSRLLTDLITERVSFLAPVEIVPGEKEMEALAEGGLRVLNGIEEPKTFDIVPVDFTSREEFEAWVARQKAEAK
ncbi:MAG: butyrate kinase [Oscillospiraceae bacterium]|jgi:butyrate kinase